MHLLEKLGHTCPPPTSVCPAGPFGGFLMDPAIPAQTYHIHHLLSSYLRMPLTLSLRGVRVGL